MPIRLRITLLTAGVLLISLLGLSFGVYYTMDHNLREEMDARLRNVYLGYRQDPGSIKFDDSGRLVFALEPDPFSSSGAYVQVTGTVHPNWTAASSNLGGERLPLRDDVTSSNTRGQPVYYNAEINGQPIRVYSGAMPFQVGAQSDVLIVQVGERMVPLNHTLQQLRTVLLGGSVVATIALAVAAWLLAGASLNPLARVSAAAATIGRSGDLSHRVEPPGTHDEVQQLAETFNEMLARLEGNFGAQRRFVADASHELRTPLTALRANSDIMLRQLETGLVDRAELVEGLSDVRSEVDRMSRLVHNLLILARADVGWRPEFEPVDLPDVARDVARIAAPLRRGQTFDLDLDDAGALERDGAAPAIVVDGNPDQLTQLMLILLDNAFTHTPPDSHVTLRLRREEHDAAIVVSDSGRGIPDQHLQRIFERFYRTDEARTRTSGGSGLGLAIARWIVSVHKGAIDVASQSGAGTTFTVRLPLATDAPTPAPLPREQKTPAVAATSSGG